MTELPFCSSASAWKEKPRDACFISVVHYIKLFAPMFAGTGQEKHTTAGGRKKRGWGLCVAAWQSTPLIWFIFKQASLYTCRITQTHPITPHNIHTIITWAPPRVKSASFLLQKEDFAEGNQLKQQPQVVERKLIWWECGKRGCDFLNLGAD